MATVGSIYLSTSKSLHISAELMYGGSRSAVSELNATKFARSASRMNLEPQSRPCLWCVHRTLVYSSVLCVLFRVKIYYLA